MSFPSLPNRLLGAAVLALLFIGSQTPDAAAQESAVPVLIRDVTVIDGTGSPGRAGLDVLIRDGLIESIQSTAGPIDFDGRVIDGSNRFLIPGIIDAHVHLSGSTRSEIQKLLLWLVEGGVTSVRDMAGDARALAGINEALISGELVGPSLYYSALMAGPPFMSDPRLDAATAGYAPGEAPYMVPLTPETDIVRAIAMAKGTGATGLKLYAALEASLVRAATEEAHRAGLRVWAHSAIFPAKPVEILDSGVDGVSHAPYVIWEADPPSPDFTQRGQGDFARIRPDGPEMDRVIEAMVRNGTLLDPTLLVFEQYGAEENGRLRLQWGADFTRRAHEAGVPIAAGTDGAGRPLAGELPNVYREMELLVEWVGFTPLEALTAATLNGALAIGHEDEFGSIRPGKAADLVLLSADPSVDVRNTRTVVHVLKGGQVVR